MAAAEPADSFVPASEGGEPEDQGEICDEVSGGDAAGGRGGAGGGRETRDERDDNERAVSVVPESEGGGEYDGGAAAAGGASDWVSDTIDGGYSRIDGRGAGKRAREEEVVEADVVHSSAPALSEEQQRVAQVSAFTSTRSLRERALMSDVPSITVVQGHFAKLLSPAQPLSRASLPRMRCTLFLLALLHTIILRSLLRRGRTSSSRVLPGSGSRSCWATS